MTPVSGSRPLLISTGLRASALRTADKIAVIDLKNDIQRNFADLVAQLDRIARFAIGDLQLRRGDRVALMLPNGIDYLEFVGGLSDAGIVSALVSEFATPREILHVCADCGARVLIVDPALAGAVTAEVTASVERVVVLDEALRRRLAAIEAGGFEPLADETDIFAIVYTSGTTGQPKGVMLSHRARTFHMLFAFAANHGYSRPHARGLALAPFFNGAGFINALAPIWFGGTTVISRKFDALQLLRDIATHRITTVFLVPTHFHAIFNLDPAERAAHDVTSLEALISGGAALPQDTKEKIVAYFGDGKLFEGYGSTEAGGVTGLRPEDQLRKKHCVGRPLSCCEVRIVDDTGSAVKDGDVGAVVCRSPWLFSGYWGRPDDTAEVLRDGWYHTGDLGRRDDEGYLYIAGRKKNMIISGGQNIFPLEVEGALHSHPGVAEAAVVGRADPYWGEAVIAYVVPKPGIVLTVEALKAHCVEHLSRYKVPKEINLMDALPKNEAGKILHRKLA